MQKILKSLVKGIGALPIDFKGRILDKEFVIKVQYKLDGSVGAQVWSGKDIIIELEGRSGEVEKKTQTFLDWAVDKKEQDLYKKKMLEFFKQVHKEVVDYNKKQGVKMKAEPKVVDMGPESVRKAAPKKVKVDVFKAPLVEKKEVKAAPKKVAAKKVVETKTKSKTRQTGSSNLAKDKQRKAQGPGKRKSASGGVYYEYRRNRTDKPGSKV